MIDSPLKAEEAAAPRSTSATIARDSIRTFAARVLVLALSVLTGIVIAKTLGPTGKGVYSGTLMMVSILMFAPAGIGTAITYALTRQQRALSELLPAIGAILVWLSLAALLGALAWGWLRGWNPVLTIFVAAVPPSAILAWQGGFYIGLGRLKNLNVQSIGLAFATLLAVTIAVTVLHAGAIGALVAWLVCLYGSACVVVWHLTRIGRGKSDEPLGKTMNGLARFGAQSGINLLLGTINYRIDSIILIAVMGAASFGIYTIAVSFGELLFMLTRPITAAVTRDIGLRDARASANITAKVIRTCTAIAAVMSVTAFAFGPWVIDSIYGTRFRDAATPLRILLPGIIAFSTAGTFAAFFIIQLGRPIIVSLVNIAMILVQAAMCLVLVPRFGMNGAAFASAVTYIAGALMNTAWFCRTTGTPFWDVWLLQPGDIRTVRQAFLDMTGSTARA